MSTIDMFMNSEIEKYNRYVMYPMLKEITTLTLMLRSLEKQLFFIYGPMFIQDKQALLDYLTIPRSTSALIKLMDKYDSLYGRKTWRFKGSQFIHDTRNTPYEGLDAYFGHYQHIQNLITNTIYMISGLVFQYYRINMCYLSNIPVNFYFSIMNMLIDDMYKYLKDQHKMAAVGTRFEDVNKAQVLLKNGSKTRSYFKRILSKYLPFISKVTFPDKATTIAMDYIDNPRTVSTSSFSPTCAFSLSVFDYDHNMIDLYDRKVSVFYDDPNKQREKYSNFITLLYNNSLQYFIFLKIAIYLTLVLNGEQNISIEQIDSFLTIDQQKSSSNVPTVISDDVITKFEYLRAKKFTFDHLFQLQPKLKKAVKIAEQDPLYLDLKRILLQLNQLPDPTSVGHNIYMRTGDGGTFFHILKRDFKFSLNGMYT